MKRSAGLALVFSIGVLAGVFAVSSVPSAGATQNAPTGPCPWPDSLDAVRAAPGNHKVLLENELVRVLDVTVQPGAREPVHAHCRPSVLVVLEGGRARDYDDRGNLIEEGRVIPEGAAAPYAFWLDRTPPHSIDNFDTSRIHLIRVELKTAAISRPQPPAKGR